MHRNAGVAAALLAILLARPAAGGPDAGSPAAVVMAVEAGLSPVEELEPLAKDRTLTLARGDRIVLAYVDSCALETIAGPGSVRVGGSSSALDGATFVERRTVDCGGRTQAGTSGGEGGALRSRGLAGASVAARAGDVLAALRAARAEEPERALEAERRPWWRRLVGG